MRLSLSKPCITIEYKLDAVLIIISQATLFFEMLGDANIVVGITGYKMDEHNPDSNYLRLQFSRFPGPRSGHGTRSKR